MPGDNIQIGPFIGGLNTKSDPTAIADNELVECENFELDLDGSLVSRPPFQAVGLGMPLGLTGNPVMLGYYYDENSTAYLLASDGLSSTYYYAGGSWTLVTSTFAAAAMTQFDKKAWMLAPVGSANPGGYWSPSTGFVAEPNMPKGNVIVGMKNRLWVAVGKEAVNNGTRLYFSKILGQPSFWQVAPDFIEIGGGDGQNIVQMEIYFQNLLIFRTNSIYNFQYTSDPTNGTVALVVPGVGLSSKDAVVGYESYFYFMDGDRAYEFINNRASQINIKVPFMAGSKTGIYSPYAVAVFNTRLMFTYWDVTYSYNLKTRSWSIWRSTTHGPIGRMVQTEVVDDLPRAIAFTSMAVPSGANRRAKTLEIIDGFTSAVENMKCIVRTKNYNYEASSTYKRLFWWGVDAVFRTRVQATATPISYNYSVLWNQLLPYMWDQLLNYTWDQPISGTLSVETTRDTTGAGAQRRFVKFLKSIRFRQIYYRMVFDTDGSINTAPVRVFSVMTYVRAKQRVSKEIT